MFKYCWLYCQISLTTTFAPRRDRCLIASMKKIALVHYNSDSSPPPKKINTMTLLSFALDMRFMVQPEYVYQCHQTILTFFIATQQGLVMVVAGSVLSRVSEKPLSSLSSASLVLSWGDEEGPHTHRHTQKYTHCLLLLGSSMLSGQREDHVSWCVCKLRQCWVHSPAT